MMMLELNEAIDHLVKADTMHLHGQVLRKEDGHVLWRALELEVEGQTSKLRRKRHGRGMLRKNEWKLA